MVAAPLDQTDNGQPFIKFPKAVLGPFLMKIRRHVGKYNHCVVEKSRVNSLGSERKRNKNMVPAPLDNKMGVQTCLLRTWGDS